MFRLSFLLVLLVVVFCCFPTTIFASNNNNNTISTFTQSRQAACSCLFQDNHNTSLNIMNGTTTTTRTQTVDGVTKNVTSINYPTNTLTISNNSNKIIFSCNNSLGQLTYYNATNYVYNYVVLMYQNKSLTTKKKAASVGAKNATKDFTSYVFKKKSIENKTTYLDFWECYDLLILNSTDVAKKVASISPTITISHILLTVIVLMLAYMANTCLSMTRHKILRNKIAELPRIKQGFNFVPSIIKKNSTFLKVIYLSFHRCSYC